MCQLCGNLAAYDCVLSLGCRHSVQPRNLSPKTHEKVCVWCVFNILIVLDQTLCL
jgi:hypothetical protein